MLDDTEIVRRLKALLALPRGKRPITVDRLEEIAGVAQNTVYEVAKTGRMQKKTRVRLTRALELVENDQLVIKKRPNLPTLISLRDPKPPQVVVQRVEFTAKGPKVRLLAINPLAFPELDQTKT